MNQELLTKLEEKGLVDNNMIILDERQAVDIPTFTTFFGDSGTYEELIEEHTFQWGDVTLNKTAAELGYADIFQKWKEDGIL